MFDVDWCRQQFPVLQMCGRRRTPVFLDGPGGTQVPQCVIDAVSHYLAYTNANHAGVFATSQASDAVVASAHQAMAYLLNAPAADEIVFGQNMTSLTLHMSRSLARTWKPGDEVVVTRLDHDANIRPWVLAARDAGATVRWVDLRPEDCTLDLEGLRSNLNERTRLVAVGAASNIAGTLNDIPRLAGWVHDVGALLYVDAVHYAPHGPIDVQAWGCDFLACSAYKFFGPHVGILWGRRELLTSLEPYKVRPAADTIPDRWMTGTQNFEGLAGVAAAVEYLATIGRRTAGEDTLPRRQALQHAMHAIQDYERGLCRELMERLAALPGVKIWGIADLNRLAERAPTVSITHAKRPVLELAQLLDEHDIYAWNGNSYALELSQRVGVEATGGFLRLGLVHYNTHEEIDAVMQVLENA